MPHKCTKSGIYGAIMANAAVDDGPIFNPKNINEASLEAQLSFAKVLNKIEGRQANVNISKASMGDGVLDTVKNRINMGRTPEALIPKRVYGKIDKKMSQWDAYYKRAFLPRIQKIEAKYQKMLQKAKGEKALQAIELRKQNELAPIIQEAKSSYRDLLGKQFKNARSDLQELYNNHAKNPDRLDAELRKMGMSRQDAYYTNQYLNWLENGGPYFEFNKGGGNTAGGDAVQEMVSTVTKNKVSFDPKQVLYNTSEFVQKAPAVAGFKNTLTGVFDAQKAAHSAKKTIFDRLPELERKGIYNNDYNALRPDGKYDTTTKTQNMLDNFSYFVGKRMGDTQKALTEIAYRPKPWNDTFGFQDPKFKNSFSFMSFQFRHMQQYGGWWKSAAKGDVKAIRSLVVYSAMTGLLFGDRAALPAPLYAIAKLFLPELDQQIKEAQKDVPILGDILNSGVIGAGSKALSNGGLELDMTKYVQPFGGVSIGIGTDITQNLLEASTKTLPKVAKEIREGRGDKAALLAINGLVTSSQLFKQGANALMQKTIDAVVKAYLEDEFTPEEISEEVIKKYFGKDAIAK